MRDLITTIFVLLELFWIIWSGVNFSFFVINNSFKFAIDYYYSKFEDFNLLKKIAWIGLLVLAIPGVIPILLVIFITNICYWIEKLITKRGV